MSTPGRGMHLDFRMIALPICKMLELFLKTGVMKVDYWVTAAEELCKKSMREDIFEKHLEDGIS